MQPRQLGGNLQCHVFLKSQNCPSGTIFFFFFERNPDLDIYSNWELGVVLPLYEDSDIPAPYLRPPPRYQQGQNAWTQNMGW